MQGMWKSYLLSRNNKWQIKRIDVVWETGSSVPPMNLPSDSSLPLLTLGNWRVTGKALETPKSQHSSMKLKRGNWTKISTLVSKPLPSKTLTAWPWKIQCMGSAKKADRWKLFFSDGRVPLCSTDSFIHFRNCITSDQNIKVDQG